ncbi:unnamed protein product [Polarella glacialis]|uniref:PDZ domain-containing protein n=1 Tax=Polarella glacialis TaxID=89957 RepID=A0A813LCY0_POLGL|nr:unnamed protein product [Polarella glacialis]
MTLAASTRPKPSRSAILMHLAFDAFPFQGVLEAKMSKTLAAGFDLYRWSPGLVARPTAASDRPTVQCEGRTFAGLWPKGNSSDSASGPKAVVDLLDQLKAKTLSVYVVDWPKTSAESKFQLEDIDQNKAVFVGSGFAYGRSASATDGPLAVCFGDGRWVLATLWGACSAADVAVLRLLNTGPVPNALPLSKSTELPQQGSWVVVCGASQFGMLPVGVTGLVSQPRQAFRGLAEEVGCHFIQLALPTLPGMSGSPVVNADGEVIAMVAKKFEEHGLALPCQRVAAVARCLEEGRAWRPPLLGIELAAGRSLTAPSVVVQAVKARGPGDLAGLQVGDVILAVEGVPISSILDVREALLSLGDSGAAVSHAGGSEADPSPMGRVTVALELRRGAGGLTTLRVVVDAPRAAPGPTDVAQGLRLGPK